MNKALGRQMLIIGWLLLLVLPPRVGWAQERIGLFAALRGQVEARLKGAPAWRPAVLHEDVFFEDSVRTAELARARELRADHTINYTSENLAEAVREATDGAGANVVCEVVGQAVWENAVASLSRGGRLVTCGAHTGGEVPLNIWNLFLQQQRLIASTGGTRSELATILKLVAEGRLEPVINATYPLKEARAAQEALSARAVIGKALLVP